MKRYRRIEITTFRRRVTITSGEFRPDFAGAQSAPVDEGVVLNDADSGAAIALESAEGQLILAEAVRSLERRLSAEARAAMCASSHPPEPGRSTPNGFALRLRALYQFINTNALRLTRKEK